MRKEPTKKPKSGATILPDLIQAKLSHSNQAQHLKHSLKNTIVVPSPNVRWEDVASLESAKQELKEAIIFPIRFPQMYVGRRNHAAGSSSTAH
jgi:SpoVK/Ycf46/Vps4 family AAA+-type ATPase